MSLIYNIGIRAYECGIAIASLWDSKARRWREGRRGLLEQMAERITRGEPIIWIHAASLGEFEQGRPIIERIKALRPDIRILLTFFSPSGYEIRKDYPGADYIFYLPSDRPENVRRFLDIVRPEAAIFIKYEFWLNYLGELRQRNIATYLVSAIFRPRSIFFRPWGGAWREALRGFRTLYVQDESSKALLEDIGLRNVVVAGDTRFDRVREIARQAKRIPIVERFRSTDDLFVAGSTWGEDERLLIDLANSNPTTRFIIAPHEMDDRRIERIIASIRGGCVRYTQVAPESDIRSAQVMILDTIGLLSSLYGYARWAYIGGGFGRGIHNTLEAATFGLPLAFGPNYQKFREAREMVARGIATPVRSSCELEAWFTRLNNDGALHSKLADAARQYTSSNCGATELVTEAVIKQLDQRTASAQTHH